MENKQYKVIDLFCGIGGLTHGLINEGFNVLAGIDNDPMCKYGYEHNNHTKFINADLVDINAGDILRIYGDVTSTISILVGCAPCQPFSKLNLKNVSDKQLEPLEKFADLIAEIKPSIVSMENVPGLQNTKKYPVFKYFLNTLDECGYKYSYKIVNVSEYGIPQTRRRLVLLASLLGDIELISPTHKDNPKTVRETIGDLEALQQGEASIHDPLHRARGLSELNLKRIKATPKDGGNSDSWNDELILECHKKSSGKTYKRSVYGRMKWDEPAPTITTQCVGIGNGRFGHPEQDRAISLREAALLQTFPNSYVFTNPKEPIYINRVAKFIGNAVPVRLGVVIGKSIRRHIKENGY